MTVLTAGGLRPPSGLLCEHFRPQIAENSLPILWVRVGADVLVALDPPQGGLGARGLDPPGVLERCRLVVGRGDDEERYSLFAEPSGVLLRPYSPGVYAQEQFAHAEDAGGEESREAANLGQLPPQYQREVGVGGILHDSRNAALRCGPQDRSSTQ